MAATSFYTKTKTQDLIPVPSMAVTAISNYYLVGSLLCGWRLSCYSPENLLQSSCWSMASVPRACESLKDYLRLAWRINDVAQTRLLRVLCCAWPQNNDWCPYPQLKGKCLAETELDSIRPGWPVAAAMRGRRVVDPDNIQHDFATIPLGHIGGPTQPIPTYSLLISSPRSRGL